MKAKELHKSNKTGKKTFGRQNISQKKHNNIYSQLCYKPKLCIKHSHKIIISVTITNWTDLSILRKKCTIPHHYLLFFKLINIYKKKKLVSR